MRPVMLLCVILTGCAGLPDAPREIKIPVSVPCLSEMPPAPKLVTDAELLALPDGAFILALAADRLERVKYMAVTDALMRACVK